MQEDRRTLAPRPESKFRGWSQRLGCKQMQPSDKWSTSQDTMGSIMALLRLAFLSISRGFSFGFYLVLLYFSFLFLLCLRLKGLKYAKHVVYHRYAIPVTFFFQKFHMNIVHTKPPLVAGFFRNSKSQRAGTMCLVCQLVGSLLRVT